MTTFRASIVVLCYSGLEETTRPCLESIIANTSADSYELIVVDNASADGTADYLKTFAAQHANVRIQLNDTNKGYAGGNNDGIKLAQGQYVVLLNNDTLVPGGWLDRLLKLFDEQPGVGLVGPVTNSAGNEQRIELEGLNEKNFEEIADAYIERQKGVWFTTEKLGFFCVAMRRTLLEKIGYLDEKFGLGMFEDDDYCMRAKRAGFTFAVVEDCFVYHKGSVSFGKMAVESYRTLFEKNRAYFREKHGVEWALTDIAFSYWEKLDKDLSAYVKNSKAVAPEIERILVRHENFKHLLVQVHRAELANTPSNIRAASSQIAVRAKWHTRWHNFKRNAIHGTTTEKLRYIRAVSGGILFRFGFNRGSGVPQEVLSRLNAIKKEDVIFFSIIDWDTRYQRPQHIVSQLAQLGKRVFYISATIYPNKSYSIRVIKENVFEVILPYHLKNWIYAEKISNDLTLLCEGIDTMILDMNIKDAVIVAEFPRWYPLIKYLKDKYHYPVVFDALDEYSGFENVAPDVIDCQNALAELSDEISVTSQKIFDNLARHSSKITIVSNATEFDYFSKLPSSGHLDALKKPIIGYYGAIDKWFDTELVVEMAKSHPDWNIVLIGLTQGSNAEILTGFHNVHLIGEVPYKELTKYLCSFDVCLIPFKICDLILSTNPVKFFEYISSGKPVVSTALPELKKYGQLLYLSENHDHFVSNVEQALKENRPDVIADRIRLAKENDWIVRAESINAIIRKAMKPS